MAHKPYGLNELREMYLKFFETKGHLRLPSFSLVPQNDKSILLINAGMTPMKPWFTGEEEPPRHRVTTCQKCIRTGDMGVGIPHQPRLGRPRARPPVSVRLRRQRDHACRRRGLCHLARRDRHPRKPHLPLRQGG